MVSLIISCYDMILYFFNLMVISSHFHFHLHLPLSSLTISTPAPSLSSYPAIDIRAHNSQLRAHYTPSSPTSQHHNTPPLHLLHCPSLSILIGLFLPRRHTPQRWHYSSYSAILAGMLSLISLCTANSSSCKVLPETDCLIV